MQARVIAHVDMDAFFASVEQRDDPGLRGRPVLVGGTGPRGVVTAASYEARVFGCRSAMPTAVAKRLCPDAVVVRGSYNKYREASTAVFEELAAFTPEIEPLSIDEAFLDLTGSLRLFGGSRAIAIAIKQRIRERVNLPASVGVAPNKFIAKLASDLEKPDGLVIIGPQEVTARLSPLPIERMWGVGPALARRLRLIGITTFADIAAADPDVLTNTAGASAQRLQQLARGEDQRAVTRDRDARSISHERTFGVNVESPVELRRVLLEQIDDVAARLRRSNLKAGRITLKLRFEGFRTITRSATLPRPTDMTVELREAGRGLLNTWIERSFEPVRLIGFAAGDIGRHGETPGLFDEPRDRDRRIDAAVDSITARMGSDAIHRARE
ncbi:MAG: DNA polymerase IV [Phycisphaerales bacterium]